MALMDDQDSSPVNPYDPRGPSKEELQLRVERARLTQRQKKTGQLSLERMIVDAQIQEMVRKRNVGKS